MTYSILLLGASSALGRKVSKYLAIYTQQFTRIAALSLVADAGAGQATVNEEEQQTKYINGRPTDSASYQGFDVVVSMVEAEDDSLRMKYIDAAVAGGVKHFYSAECQPCLLIATCRISWNRANSHTDGADISRAPIRDDPYLSGIVMSRLHLETQARADPSLGYTYLMTGLPADLLLEADLLGLSKNRASATCIGSPDALVSVTHQDE